MFSRGPNGTRSRSGVDEIYILISTAAIERADLSRPIKNGLRTDGMRLEIKRPSVRPSARPSVRSFVQRRRPGLMHMEAGSLASSKGQPAFRRVTKGYLSRDGRGCVKRRGDGLSSPFSPFLAAPGRHDKMKFNL